MNPEESVSWKSERARVAALTRSRQPADPDLVSARNKLAAARLEDHIRRVVAEAPPFTPEQKARLRGLFNTLGG